jgi:hypothetical protein
MEEWYKRSLSLKHQLCGCLMTGISMTFLVLVLVIKMPKYKGKPTKAGKSIKTESKMQKDKKKPKK